MATVGGVEKWWILNSGCIIFDSCESHSIFNMRASVWMFCCVVTTYIHIRHCSLGHTFGFGFNAIASTSRKRSELNSCHVLVHLTIHRRNMVSENWVFACFLIFFFFAFCSEVKYRSSFQISFAFFVQWKSDSSVDIVQKLQFKTKLGRLDGNVFRSLVALNGKHVS